MVGHGGSSAGSYLADPTSPIPSHCASIVATSTLRDIGDMGIHINYCCCKVRCGIELATRLISDHVMLKHLAHHCKAGMDERELHKHEKEYKYGSTHTVNPRFKPWGLINFMVHNHPGSNQERGQIETTNLSNRGWMDKLTRV